MSAYNFVRCEPNFTPKKSFWSKPFRFCCYLHRFQRYLRWNTKVVVKRTKFSTFFVLPNFKWAVHQKVVHALTFQPRDTSRAKVSSGYTP